MINLTLLNGEEIKIEMEIDNYANILEQLWGEAIEEELNND